MYTFAQMLNIFQWIKGKTAFTAEVITAAAGHDGSAVNGHVIDRLSTGFGLSEAGKLSVEYTTSVNTGETLTAALKVQHGDASDGSDMADYVDSYGHGALASAVVESGLLVAKDGTLEINVALDGAKRYIRGVVTFNLSRGGTDTVAYGGGWAFGGFHEIPQTDLSYSVTA